jgi:hypothetical protein
MPLNQSYLSRIDKLEIQQNGSKSGKDRITEDNSVKSDRFFLRSFPHCIS